MPYVLSYEESLLRNPQRPRGGSGSGSFKLHGTWPETVGLPPQKIVSDALYCSSCKSGRGCGHSLSSAITRALWTDVSLTRFQASYATKLNMSHLPRPLAPASSSETKLAMRSSTAMCRLTEFG